MKVEIDIKEVQALDELFKDAKCPIPMGFVLGSLRIKIQQEVVKEQERQLKEKYIKKK